jgi:glucose uptake protein GlcU
MEPSPSSPDKKPSISWVSIAVTLGSYFFLKYVVAAQMYDVNDTSNLPYTLGLILASVFFGRAVDRWLESRKEK